MQDHPKWQRQVDLEEEMRSLGIQRFRDLLEDAQKYGTETEVGAMRRLLGVKAPELVALLKERFYAKREGKAGRGHAAARYLRQIEPELAALIALRGTLDRLSGLPSYQKVCGTIGAMVEDEIHFRHFKELEAERVKAAKGAAEPGIDGKRAKRAFSRYEQAVEIATKNTPNQLRRRKQIRTAADNAGVEWSEWNHQTTMLVGMALFEALHEATGLVEKLKNEDGLFSIVATPEVREWLKLENLRCEALTPVFLPTVIPPKPWDNPWTGGYYTNRVRSIRVLKTGNKPYLEELEGADLSEVYAALNNAQNTPWSVNASVFNVLIQMVEKAEGFAMAGHAQPEWFPLPTVDLVPIPETPADLKDIPTKDMTEEQLARLKRRNNAARAAHKTNATSLGRRAGLYQTIKAAEKMLPEGRFYMPYQLDFRGRLYAVPAGLNPQGNDLSKALLRFAEALPILDQTAADWLAVHGAGTFGVDKVSFAERVQWVKDHEAEIIASADDPFGCTFWAEMGDKKGKWQALAFCFEWAGFRRVGFGFKSCLPIAQDGTCNGLQNFSAMLLDEVGGAAVNLIPGDKPNDIYQVVADRVIKLVELDAFEGDTETQHWARGWVGRVNRSVTKRPVMTLPYGAQQYGFTEQIQMDTVAKWKAEAEQGKDAFPWETTFGPSQYMAKLVWQEVQQVVVKAAEAMEWLRGAAQKAARDGLPVRWTTPCGLPVQQRYEESDAVIISTSFGGTNYRMQTLQPNGKLNKRKQGSALPPNFVHSLDAAHMQRTVNACAGQGITSFALIHDSYGTHAANAQRMADTLRAEFVRMYSEKCILGTFKTELEEQMGAPGALGPIPQKGTLDLSKVLESRFFFA